jgi:zinc finger protein
LDFNKPIEDQEDLKGESHEFPTTCHVCYQNGVSKMCMISVPFFKELIIMAFTCDRCGAHTSEIKTGGEIGAKGKKITIAVETEDDLKRDLFKSETAKVILPDIDFEMDYGTLGGKYTTVEGLIDSIYENFKKNNPFMGDSDSALKQKINEFYQ